MALTLHQLLPLIASALNVLLAALALVRHPTRWVNRVFACFAGAMTVWTLGVFFLRQAPDGGTAYLLEVVIHVGVVAIPALYYHFVLAFLDEARARRPSLALAYGIASTFMVLNLAGSPLFLRGATRTFWGWAPAAGPLYLPFFLYFNAVLVVGLVRLVRGYRRADSSFRRNRILLVVLGTALSLSGGFVDFVRFLLARVAPAAEQLYPVGIPANMVFALALGISIVRYRLFPVNLAAKKAAVYLTASAGLTGILLVVHRTAGPALGWRETGPLWIIGPAALTLALLLGPFGQRIDDLVERLMFSQRRGCYDTLLALSKRISGILELEKLVTVLLQGLTRGIPVTHAMLLVQDPDTKDFTVAGRAPGGQAGAAPGPLAGDSALVQWLDQSDGVLVSEAIPLDSRSARHFGEGPGEPAPGEAAVIVPLKVEGRLTGILLLGEKVSGEIFDTTELEMLSLLANQTATALSNARLYRQAQEAYEELARTQDQLAQAQKLEAVGRLAGGIAHDFNNLLTVITGRVGILQEHLHPEHPLRRDVDLIEQTADRATALIRQLRAFGKKQVLRPAVLPLDALVEDVVPMLRRLIGEHIELVTRHATRPCPVRADRAQLEQVIVNLVVNARDAMATGGRIAIETSRVEPDAAFIRRHPGARPGPHALLRVRDTGAGMTEEIQAHIFEPFFTTKAIGQGTGLGLATVYGIVQQSGGHIHVESAVRAGTTVEISLPLVEEEAPGAAAEPPHPLVRGGHEIILVVEDEAEVRALAREVLEKHGYCVLEAGGGMEALAISQRGPEPIDLLLTDVVMPDLSGQELARRLLVIRPHLRVLYMSGYAPETVLPPELREGGAAVLEKPFNRQTLARAVRQALDAPAPRP